MLILGIILSVIGVVAAIGATWVALKAFNRDVAKDEQAETKQQEKDRHIGWIRDALEPVKNQISGIDHKIDSKFNVLDRRLVIQETMMIKVDDYVRSMILKATQGMHQPDPRRLRIDQLLEKMQAEYDPQIDAPQLYLTKDEKRELAHYMELVLDYKEHASVDNMVRDEENGLEFPYYPFDSVYAAILLPALKVDDGPA